MVVKGYLYEFYQELQGHIKEVAQKETTKNDLPQAFRVLCNRVAICGEITDDYMSRLAGSTSPLSQSKVRLRLKYVYRDFLFVGMMSTVEYYFIKSLLLCPQLEPAKKIINKGERKVHLSDLIVWAKNMLDDYHLWDFSVKLRNDIVHFDAIARQTMVSPNITYPVQMQQGNMASGVLRSFISLSRAIESSFFNFVMNLPSDKITRIAKWKS